MTVIFGFALRYCYTEYQSCSALDNLEGPSLAELFKECKDERRWIDAHLELARVDSALALELEFDHKTSIRHYL